MNRGATAARAPGVVAACAMLLAACQPTPTESVVYVTTRATSRTVPTATTAPVVPDAHGFLPAPSGLLSQYVALEAPPAGELLVDLQEAMDRRDWRALTARIAPKQMQGPPVLQVYQGMPGDWNCGVVTHDYIATALEQLAQAGSRPRVQGYFAWHNGPFQLADGWNGDANAMIGQLDVVVSGWTGPIPALCDSAGSGTPVPDAVPGVAVWRFQGYPGSDPTYGWSWADWRWYGDGAYDATLWIVAAQLIDARLYHIVRPRDLWPTRNATVQREVPSPDGQWLAREVATDLVRIDPRDPTSALRYSAIEVVDPHGEVNGRPLEFWEGDGIPSHSPGIVGWRPGRVRTDRGRLRQRRWMRAPWRRFAMALRRRRATIDAVARRPVGRVRPDGPLAGGRLTWCDRGPRHRRGHGGVRHVRRRGVSRSGLGAGQQCGRLHRRRRVRGVRRRSAFASAAFRPRGLAAVAPYAAGSGIVAGAALAG